MTDTKGLIELLREAAQFIHAVHSNEKPNIRYPLSDELEGYAVILSAQQPDQQEPVAAQIRVAIASDSGWSEWREIDIKDADREYRAGVETRKLYTALAAQQPIEPAGLPFVPWSKEAEMRESWVEQAQPEPTKLSKFKLLAITTAYEQGVGKGKQRTDFNPYSEGTDEREAWRLGYQEGEGMAEQAQPEPVATIYLPFSKNSTEPIGFVFADETDNFFGSVIKATQHEGYVPVYATAQQPAEQAQQAQSGAQSASAH